MTPRVLQVILSFNPGGTERLVLELAARLHGEMPMQVVCLDEPGPWAHEVQSRGIEVEALRRSHGFRPALGLAIARAAHRHGASVIHAHQVPRRSSTAAWRGFGARVSRSSSPNTAGCPTLRRRPGAEPPTAFFGICRRESSRSRKISSGIWSPKASRPGRSR